MIEIKSSKKCCKCFREENALLHLIWILLCSIESPPSLSYEESAGWDGGAAEHVVRLVTDCSTAAAPAPANGEPAAGSLSCSRGHCSLTTILLLLQHPSPPSAGRYPAAGVGLQFSDLDIGLYWYSQHSEKASSVLQSSQRGNLLAMFLKTILQRRKIFAGKCLNFRQ